VAGPWDPDWLHQSARHFAAVGLVVGALAAAVLWGAALALPLGLAVGLSMLAAVLCTGAFHEDGLADTFDALGGSAARERALEIMKDSRLGAYGVLALLGSLACKGLALHAVAEQSLALALALLPMVHAMARTAAVALMAALPYAGDADHAKAKPLAQRAGFGTLAVNLGWCGLALLLAWAAGAAPLALISVGAGAWIALPVLRAWFQRRLGGYTGDTLGAAEQIAELGAWLALAAWAGAQ
jgi:adenosylcobinamide-GDP ribazoletransferase